MRQVTNIAAKLVFGAFALALGCCFLPSSSADAADPASSDRPSLLEKLKQLAPEVRDAAPARPSSCAEPERIPVEATAKNAVISIEATAYCLLDAVADVQPPKDSRYLLLEGRLTNPSTTTAMTLPPAAELLILQFGAGRTAKVNPKLGDILFPSSKRRPLHPLDDRSFAAVFEVPRGELVRPTLIVPSRAGVLALPLKPGVELQTPIATLPVEDSDLSVGITAVERVERIGGREAPAGQDFLVASLRLDNPLMERVDTSIANFIILSTRQGGNYSPEAPPVDDGEWFGTTQTIFPGVPVIGKLAFLLPKNEQHALFDGRTEIPPSSDTQPLELGQAEPPALGTEIKSRSRLLSLTRREYEPGWWIYVSLNLPPEGLPEDAWIGVVPAAVPHGDVGVNDEYDTDYKWLNGQTAGFLELEVPSEPGDYTLRLNEHEDKGRELDHIAFRVVEQREEAPARLPDLKPAGPVNVAAAPFGTKASGGYSDSAWRMIDGDRVIRRRDPAYGPLGREAPMTLELGRAYRIERLLLDLDQPDDRLYRYLIEGSLDGQAWSVLVDRSTGKHRGRQDLTIEPQTIKFIRVIGTESPGHDRIYVVELEALTRDPVPLDGSAELVHDHSLPMRRNVAYAIYGGRVLDASGVAATALRPEFLIDGNTEAPGWIADTPLSPHEVTLGFRDGRATTIDSIAFRGLPRPMVSYSPHTPRVVVVEAHEPGVGWRHVGRYGLFETTSWQKISFAPVRADRVRLNFYETRREGFHIGLAEIAVLERAEDRAASILEHRTGDGGLNIALAALGGRVESVSNSDDDDNWQGLIDGQSDDEGWRTHNERFPKEIVLSFRAQRTAMIGGVALYPGSWGSRKMGVKQFEVLASQHDAPDAFRSLGIFHLDMQLESQVFTFPPVPARYVKLRILSNHGEDDDTTLGEIEVLEAAYEGYSSILGDEGVNLTDRRFGGHIVFPVGSGMEALIDGDLEGKGWTADGEPPFDLVFGFHRHKPARLNRIILRHSDESKPENRVQRFKLLVSSTGPHEGFRAVGDYELNSQSGEQVFTFDETLARFVKLRILSNHGGNSYEIGDVALPEVLRPGDRSVLSRLPEAELTLATAPESVALPAETREGEPNHEQEKASRIALGRPTSGRVDPPDDIDWYRIDTSEARLLGLNVTLEEIPLLRVVLELFDNQGNRIDTEAVYEREGNRARFSWQVPQGTYYLRVSRPPTSIATLTDLSPSTNDVRGEITQALHAFVGQTTPFEQISITGFCGDIVPGIGFSSSRQLLEEAAYKMYQGCGGTALFESLEDAIGSLSTREGLKAILLITDGEDSGSNHDELRRLWELALAARVKIYTIGYGDGLDNRLDGFNGDELLRSWASATGGRHFQAPSGEDIARVMEFIGDELRKVSEYRLTVSLPRGEGLLRVVETGESLGGVATPSQIALILDASGSMRGRLPDGKTKMEVAQWVLNGLIVDLPAETRLGLRVYGHRYPSKPKKRSCEDTELIVPFGRRDEPQLNRLFRAILHLKPKGQTPIGLSLQLLKNDLEEMTGNTVVIVVTDGIETCDPKPGDPYFPPDVVKNLQARGIDVKVHVVGFDIEKSATRTFLKTIAEAGDGRYFDADNANALLAALQEAIRADFVVTDSAGNIVERAQVGDAAVRLPEGRYSVTLHTEPPLEISDVEVEYERETRLSLDKEGSEIGVDRETIGGPPAEE